MVELQSASCRFYRRTTLTALCLGLLAGPFAPVQALARHHHHGHRGRVVLAERIFGRVRPAHVRPGSYAPPFSAYAVDGNSGRVLFGRDENALRHPASLTKVMTLYLLFDQLEKGHLSLDTRIEVSPHAASQAPTKLGLRPGSAIRVEDAIKAIVTKSANDMAVAIAERIGGSESGFAAMMTRKAHALGMSRSNFVNASGLPDDMQLTTARDLVTLGRAIHDHFPRYFRYFSTPSFTYAGQYMANHNHLMEQVDGMDGIKTGYTRMSGFNLLSSVNRNGHWLVSVVIGGKTRLGRDRIMADLIEAQIDKCATRRTAPMIAENPDLEHVAEAIPVIQHEGEAAPPVEGVDDDSAERGTDNAPTQAMAAEPEPVAEAAPAAVMSEPEQEATTEPPARIRKRAEPMRVARPSPEAGRARPAFVSNAPIPPDRDMLTTGSIRLHQVRLDGSTTRYDGAETATPSTRRHGSHDRAATGEKMKPIKLASLDSYLPSPTGRPSTAHDGWMIQIGAPDNLAAANDLIAHAKSTSRGTLSRAQPFTEKVQKGGATLYRARFAGLDPDTAASACKSLKRAGMSCFTTKN